MGPKKKLAIMGLAILATLAALPQAGCSLFSVTIGNAVRNRIPAPNAHSASLVRKRAQKTQAIEAAFAAFEASANFTRHATATDDRCYKGENNWKVQTGYAHRCTIRMTRFYGIPGDFATSMIGLEKRLSANQWTLPHYSITERLKSYDRLCGRGRLPVFGGERFPSKCSLSEQSKPHERYVRGNLELFIAFAEKEAQDLSSMEQVQNIAWNTRFETYNKQQFQNVRMIFQDLSQSYPYVLVISIQATYFEN